MPLASFTIANLGADDVDLTDVASISFEFDAAPAARSRSTTSSSETSRWRVTSSS